jgi:hypothetical protein
MEFNNGNERRKLNKKWERLRVQYQQAGMSEDAIQAMYDFDLGVLNSERSYVANTLAIVDDGDDNTGRKSSDFKQYEKAITVTDTYHETRTRFAWVGEIKDKRLQEGLEKLSDEELRLITLYFRDEYSTVELSKVYGIAQQNISKRMKNRKKACPATKSGPPPATSSRSSRTMPERASSISCWYSCSTVSVVSQMKRPLLWNGLYGTASGYGVPKRVSSVSTTTLTNC